MSHEWTVSRSFGIDKLNFEGARKVSAALQKNAEGSTAAGKSGTVTTRASGTDCIVTLGEGHGFQADDIIDLYWGSSGTARGVTVTGITSTTVHLEDQTAGSAFPALTTVVTVAHTILFDVSIVDTTKLTGIVCYGEEPGYLTFENTTANFALQVTRAKQVDGWISGDMLIPTFVSNLISVGDLTGVRCSHSSLLGSKLFRLAFLLDV